MPRMRISSEIGVVKKWHFLALSGKFQETFRATCPSPETIRNRALPRFVMQMSLGRKSSV